MRSNKKEKRQDPRIKYKPEYCQMLEDHMAQGFSFESFGAKASTCRNQLYAWCDKYPDFKKAKMNGKEKSLLHFEQLLVVKARGQNVGKLIAKDIDATMTIFTMKTRFSDTYAEKNTITIETNDQMFDLLTVKQKEALAKRLKSKSNAEG